ncbi:hypothetical protein FOL47_005111 [Perkinsus chesapeaki]|uniref:Uncharacterized protein n=1 Tax=Perkinsus chesapeaki TaxID=330153 RepID=A0A7J6LZR2_PERCH|nr:hypothetical protein FOL47_005111 [Perkinsus chesapeaki]
MRHECGALLMNVFGREKLRDDGTLLEFVEELQHGNCPSERLRSELDEVSKHLYSRVEELEKAGCESVNSTSPHTPSSGEAEVNRQNRLKAADCFEALGARFKLSLLEEELDDLRERHKHAKIIVKRLSSILEHQTEDGEIVKGCLQALERCLDTESEAGMSS